MFAHQNQKLLAGRSARVTGIVGLVIGGVTWTAATWGVVSSLDLGDNWVLLSLLVIALGGWLLAAWSLRKTVLWSYNLGIGIVALAAPTGFGYIFNVALILIVIVLCVWRLTGTKSKLPANASSAN